MTTTSVAHGGTVYAEGKYFSMIDRGQVPLLADTEYLLKVAAEVTDPEGKPQTGPKEFTQPLMTRAPRFGIDPEWVFACYPAPGDKGDFSRVLPHLALSRAFLPWERAVSTGSADATLPWLALLVVTDQDVVADSRSGQLAGTRPIADLAAGPDGADEGVAWPELGEVRAELLGSGKTEGEACRTIRVKTSAIRQNFPTRSDLAHLTHVREVTDDPPSGYSGVARRHLTIGAYSVMLSNRLPRTPETKYTVHLVSLEGWRGWDFMGGKRSLEGYGSVPLVSLWSWWFETTKPTSSDTGSYGVLARLRENVSPLRVPVKVPAGGTAAEKRAAGLVEQGFLPFAQSLASGESTFGWYRGALSPVLPPPSEEKEREKEDDKKQRRRRSPDRLSADALLVYDREQAVFNASYASARTLGELICASNSVLCGALTRFRAEAVAVAQRVISEMVAGRQPGESSRQKLHGYFDEGLGDRITAALRGPVPPKASASRRRSQEVRPSLAQLLALLAGPGEAGGGDLDPGTAALREELDKRLDEKWQGVMNRHAPLVREAGLRRDGLLAAVPFDHLVPDLRLLPEEGVRTFFVDPNWVDALTLGVCLYGAASALEVNASLRMRRAVEQQMELSPDPSVGVLIRSRFLHQFPGATVVCTPAPVISRQAAPDVLLCLFDPRPSGAKKIEVRLRESPHAFHFGLDEHAGNGTLELRQIEGSPGAGTNLKVTGVYDHLRPGSEVLSMTGTGGLMGKVAAKLGQARLTPSQFALQLVVTPQQLTITVPLS